MKKYIGILIFLFILVFASCRTLQENRALMMRTFQGHNYDGSISRESLKADSIEFVYFNNEWIPGADMNMVCPDSIKRIEIKNDEYGNRCAYISMSSSALNSLKKRVDKANEGLFLEYGPFCEFPGGNSKMRKWVEEQIRIPAGFKGKERVVVSFLVLPDGEVIDGKIIKGSENEEVNSEALRLVESLPKFDVVYYTPKKDPIHFAWPIVFEEKETQKRKEY